MPLTSGTRLGPYEILEPIGKGGMGEVYRARDTKLDRDVAIKVLPEEFASDAERLARFEREAKLLASLNHPNIAAIHGFEESDGVNALVLELVEGPTLAERIELGPIPVDEALAIAKQIAEALEAGHEAGVIHRDLKPANIKLKEDGTVKVLDYGLAKALENDAHPATDSELSQSPTLARHGTQIGVILGTAAYMSPEQAKGKRVDRRTDIWAFGAVVYEMLTAKRAFGREDVSETLAAVLRDEPNWKRLPPETPVAVRGLLARCLRKDPNRRVHDAADVRIELEDASSAPMEEPSALSGPSRGLFYTVALTAIIATAVAVWALVRAGATATAPIARTVIPLASNEPLFLTARPTVAISPDGRELAYVTTHGDTTQLYLRSLDELDARLVEGGDGASMPFFSPDGRWLGFARSGSLMKVSMSGGAPVVVCDMGDDSPRGASWTSDGRIVLVPFSTGGIQIVPEDGGAMEVVKRPDWANGEKTFRFPDVLPGGRDVVFTLGTSEIDSWDDAAIAVMSLETGEHRVVLEGGSHATYSPTGHLVYARAGSLFAVPFDARRREVTGAPTPMVDGVITSPTKGPAPFSLSRTGSLVYAPGKPWGVDFRIVSVDREGRSENLVDVSRAYLRAKPSPTGKALVLSVDNANAGLWIYDLERGTSNRLVSGFDNLGPVWAPDGEKLAFSSNRAGAYQVYWQDAAGRGEPERLESSQNGKYPSSWARNGQLAFNEFHPETGWDLSILTLDGERTRTPFLRTSANEELPMFSPDGHWIAYESDESGRSEVYLRAYPDSGAKWPISTNGGAYAIWSPDGREIFYREDNKMMAVDFRALDGRPELGRPEVLFEKDFVYDAYGEVSYSIMPDGNRFVMIDGSDAALPPTELILVQNWSEELKRLVPTE